MSGQELSDTEAARRLQRITEKVGDLPAMPEIVAEVLQLIEDPSSALEQVSEAIERDPNLTAKVLKISNSAYYGMKQHVGTVKLATVILGLREIRNVVLGVSLFDALRHQRTGSLMAGEFRVHSFLVAAIAKQLSKRLRLGFEGEAFIAGLLHDIGKMVLARHLGERYGSVLAAAGGYGEALCRAERDAFGFSHAEAAAVLAARWNLPATLIGALLLHHRGEGGPLLEAKDPKLAAVVRIADLAARDNLGAVNGPATANAASDEEGWGPLMDVPDAIPRLSSKPVRACGPFASRRPSRCKGILRSMSKKKRIVIHRDENLQAIDDELDSAMSRLDGTNERIGELLAAIAPPDADTTPGEEAAQDSSVASEQEPVSPPAAASPDEAPPESS